METSSMELTPLMRAATEEDVSILVEMLALHSDDIQSTLFMKDRKGRTALDWARLSRNHLGVSILKKAMTANISRARLDVLESHDDVVVQVVETNKYQIDSLFQALRNRDGVSAMRIINDNRLFREEVENVGEKFFVDVLDQFGYSPIVLAAGMNLLDVVNALIDIDVNIDHKNKYGHNALTWASASGHADVVRLLLFKGANIHHTTLEGRTALHYACKYGKARVVEVLLQFLFERYLCYLSVLLVLVHPLVSLLVSPSSNITSRVATRFATQRLQQSQWKYDPTRWSSYATFMENFLNVRFEFMSSTPANSASVLCSFYCNKLWRSHSECSTLAICNNPYLWSDLSITI